MRKGHEKILKSCKKRNFPLIWQKFMENETYSIRKLQIIYGYFCVWKASAISNKPSVDKVISEVERVFSFQDKNTLSEKEFLDRVEYYLLPIYREDTLFNNYKKKGIAYIKDSERFKYSSLYQSMVYYEIPFRSIRSLIKKCNEKNYSCRRRLENSPFLLREYDIKKEKSVLYYLVDNNLYLDFYQGIKLNELMNDKKTWDSMDFNLLFIKKDAENEVCNVEIDWYYINEIKTATYVLFKKMKEKYAVENNSVYYKACVDELISKQFCELVLKTKISVTAAIPYQTLYIRINSSGFINIHYNLYNTTSFYFQKSNNEIGIAGVQKKKEMSFFISPNMLFFETKNERTYPLSIVKFLSLGNENCDTKELIDFLCSILMENNIFFADVFKDFEKGFIAPLVLNDIYNFHNRKQLITNKYKKSLNYNVNWNNQSLNISYLIVKSIPYVFDEKSIQILLQQKDKDFLMITQINEMCLRRYKEKVNTFLSLIICNRITKNPYQNAEIVNTGILDSEIEEEKFIISRDYVDMCFRSKSKVKLTISSLSELRNKHDNILNKVDIKKETKLVDVPNNSVFNKLKTILPDTFEWINTRERLIMEAELQHHCVWTYAEKISDDLCAIYSFVDREGIFQSDGIPKRYTVEFGISDTGYYVIQTQGKYDRVNTNIMREYIESLLCVEN